MGADRRREQCLRHRRREACYLLRLYWASLSKLSKSRESYLLLVEAGSKSSEWESVGLETKQGDNSSVRGLPIGVVWSCCYGDRDGCYSSHCQHRRFYRP